MDEMLEFAQSSEMFKKLIPKLRLNTIPRIMFDVALISRPWITVYTADLDIIFKFYGEQSPKRARYFELEKKSLKIRDSETETLKTLQFHFKGEEVIIGFHDSIDDVILLAKHLAELFNLSIRSLAIAPEHLDQLDKILSIETFKKAKEVTIPSGTVSHAVMRRVLEDFKPERLSVQCSPEPGFEFHNGTISAGHFHDLEEQRAMLPSYRGDSSIRLLDNTSWFKFPMLQTTSCREFHLETRSITNEDVNQFLHRWCNGTDTNRMTINITKTRYIHEHDGEKDSKCYQEDSLMDDESWKNEKLDFVKILEGLERFMRPWNHNDKVPVLRRETDGMLMPVDVYNIMHDASHCHLTPYFEIDRARAAMENHMAQMAQAMHGVNLNDILEMFTMN